MTNYLPALDEQFGAQQADLLRRIATLEQQVNHLSFPAGNTATSPAINGLQAWTFDPATAGTAMIPNTGVLWLNRIYITSAMTVNNIWVTLNGGGSGLIGSENFLGLYNSSGTLVGQTSDQTTAWGSGGNKKGILTAAVNLTSSSVYYVAMLANGTTAPNVFVAGGSVNPAQQGLVAAPFRAFTTGSGLTSLPSSVTLTSGTATLAMAASIS